MIDFTKKIRVNGKYSVSQQDLANLFSSQIWVDCKKTGGHRKLKNIVTGVVVEYASHGNKGGIDPGAVATVLNTVQEHLNILGNTIFMYKQRNWKVEPNYQASAKRWNALKQ